MSAVFYLAELNLLGISGETHQTQQHGVTTTNKLLQLKDK